MAMLVAGVFSASLGLIYASIAVSILAAITLGAGVLLRRRELFGAAADGEVRPGWAAADIAGTRSPGIRPDRIAAATTGPASAGQPAGPGREADDRARTSRGDRGAGAEKDSDLAEMPRKAASGAGSGSSRWPGSIAAKGASAAVRRGGDHSAAHAAGRGRSTRSAPGTGPAARDPAARAPAPREPARGDRAGTRTPPHSPAATRPWPSASPPPGIPAARRHRGGTRTPPRRRPRPSGCPQPRSEPPGPATTQPAADMPVPRRQATTSGTG